MLNKMKAVLVTLVVMLTGCAIPQTGETRNYFAERAERQSKSASVVVKNAAVVHARMRALIPGTALFEELESSCRQGKQIEVIVPAETAASLSGRKTCFPVFFSTHPEVRPQVDIMLVDRTDIYVGGNYFGTNTSEVLQEYQFQRFVKANGF